MSGVLLLVVLSHVLWLSTAYGQAAPTTPVTGAPTVGATAATATLRDRDGQTVASADLRQAADQVTITLTFPQGSRLSGTHAIHIHERGLCSPPDFADAGGIFNPLGKQHGFLNPDGPMVGDLPDLVLGSDGLARYSVAAPLATLGTGPASLLRSGGTSLVIDSGVDDNKSQPAGNSGAAIACGVILAPGQADPSPGRASAGALSPFWVGLAGVILVAGGFVLRRSRLAQP